jgi:hypothetical protein
MDRRNYSMDKECKRIIKDATYMALIILMFSATVWTCTEALPPAPCELTHC